VFVKKIATALWNFLLLSRQKKFACPTKKKAMKRKQPLDNDQVNFEAASCAITSDQLAPQGKRQRIASLPVAPVAAEQQKHFFIAFFDTIVQYLEGFELVQHCSRVNHSVHDLIHSPKRDVILWQRIAGFRAIVGHYHQQHPANCGGIYDNNNRYYFGLYKELYVTGVTKLNCQK